MDAGAAADQQVFLMYRKLFENSNVRKEKIIRKILLHHSPELTASGDTHIDKIVSILKSLLKDRVFQSEEQASKHFPELFTKPPSERPTRNIAKKRKASPKRSINVRRVVRTEAINEPSLGTTTGTYLSHSFD
jgi:hypothetical protein